MSTTRCSRRSACARRSSSLLASPGGADELLDRLADPARVRSARLRWPGSTRRWPRSTPTGSSRRSGCGCAPTWSSTPTTRSSSTRRTTCSCPGRPRRWSCRWPSRRRSPRCSTSTRRVRGWGRCAVAGGEQRDAPPVARAGARPDLPGDWVEHDELIVAGQPVRLVAATTDGQVHACTVDGLARGLAWAAGRWDLRLLLAAALETPSRLGDLLAESRLETRHLTSRGRAEAPDGRVAPPRLCGRCGAAAPISRRGGTVGGARRRALAAST